MRILITGVAGFIGSNLAIRLLQTDNQVIGIDNMSYGEMRNINSFLSDPRFEFIQADLCNALILKDIDCDVIVHLASQKIPRYSNALRTLEENNIMLKTIVDKAILDKCKIVYASTSDVYGKNPNLPFSENSDLVLGPTTVKRWAYALSKIYGEQYIIANSDQYNIDYTIVRFFGSYGPNHNLTWWGGPQSVFITKAFNQEPIEIHGNGNQTRVFTYIDDTIDALIPCIFNEKSNKEIFNISSDASEEISINALAKLIWELINGVKSKAKLKYVPYSSFGKYEDVERRVADIEKIKDYFNYKPAFTLRNGLINTIEWQRIILNR
jgi:UDP-glucose 4-epimerase